MRERERESAANRSGRVSDRTHTAVLRDKQVKLLCAMSFSRYEREQTLVVRSFAERLQHTFFPDEVTGASSGDNL